MHKNNIARFATFVACAVFVYDSTTVNGDATLTIRAVSTAQDGTNFDFVVDGPGFGMETQPEFQGCFNNPTSSPVLTGYFFTSQQMTNTLCRETCAQMGFLYAGAQDSDSCYCGSTPFDILGPSSSCTMPCQGNPFEICGDEEAFTVWTTGGEFVPAPGFFALDDEPSQTDAIEQSVTFDNLPSGDYSIRQEDLPTGWSLESIDCGAAPHTRDGDSVMVMLADGANITCTFANQCVGGPGAACSPCDRAKGDVTGDGSVDIDDMAGFVDVLLDPSAASPDDLCVADTNGDEAVNGKDVQPFLELLMMP